MDILDFCICSKDDDGYSYNWHTFGDLLERLQAVTEEAGEIDHIRWEGIPNARDEAEPLPPAEALSVNVERHWHDGIPKIRLYAQQQPKDSGEPITCEYLYGLVYDPSSGPGDDWTEAFELASRLRGAISPDNNRRRHPNYDRHGVPTPA